MVNYCCVQGCGRNSKHSSHLNYYSLPKGRHRQEQWLKAAGREDLIGKLNQKLTHRFCSRHFAPSSIKNRNLCPDAIPTLCLPGSNIDDGCQDEPLQHHDIICNSCSNIITGFRYKCVSCQDYDLCPKCEMLERHAHHYMIRIPKPLKFKIADDLISKWRSLFKSEHVKANCNESTSESGDSSDDEPITKYVNKHYDSGVDLSEDVKESIRKEVTRVLKLKDLKKKSKRAAPKERVIYATKRKQNIDDNKILKKSKIAETLDGEKVEVAAANTSIPEVVFADVDNYVDHTDQKYVDHTDQKYVDHTDQKYVDHTDQKYEVPFTQTDPEGSSPVDAGQVLPVMHVKLSDDLSELMIEMTQNGQKTLYRYADGPP